MYWSYGWQGESMTLSASGSNQMLQGLYGSAGCRAVLMAGFVACRVARPNSPLRMPPGPGSSSQTPGFIYLDHTKISGSAGTPSAASSWAHPLERSTANSDLCARASMIECNSTAVVSQSFVVNHHLSAFHAAHNCHSPFLPLASSKKRMAHRRQTDRQKMTLRHHHAFGSPSFYVSIGNTLESLCCFVRGCCCTSGTQHGSLFCNS